MRSITEELDAASAQSRKIKDEWPGLAKAISIMLTEQAYASKMEILRNNLRNEGYV